MKKLLICFLGGLLAGTILANFMQLGPLDGYVDYTGAISYINKLELFWYIWSKRALHLFIIWLLSLTIFCQPVLYGYSAYYGFATGTMISILTMDLGLKSIIAYMGLHFPQTLIYLPVWIFFAFQCLRESGRFRQVDLYGRKKTFRPMLFRWSLIFLIVLTLFTIGTFLEAFINPWMLQKVFRMM